MRDVYLIQRAKFKEEIELERNGIDQIIEFDYMGASEFEWGALPKSLERIREGIKGYLKFQCTIPGYDQKIISVYCKKSDQDKIQQILEDLTEKKIRLKAFCDLCHYVKGAESDCHHNDFWWDIMNDWFFWKQNTDFEEIFLKLIQPNNN